MEDKVQLKERNRLVRIDGQIKGIINMMDEKKPCEEILMQLSAAEKAIRSLARVLIKEHMSHCMVKAFAENNVQRLEEFNTVLESYLK